jgi:hypothetical protein
MIAKISGDEIRQKLAKGNILGLSVAGKAFDHISTEK